MAIGLDDLKKVKTQESVQAPVAREQLKPWDTFAPQEEKPELSFAQMAVLNARAIVQRNKEMALNLKKSIQNDDLDLTFLDDAADDPSVDLELVALNAEGRRSRQGWLQSFRNTLGL